ncbi:MAG: type II toxin-antitoxin system HicB family antitoxin [Nitrospirota bacterium]
MYSSYGAGGSSNTTLFEIVVEKEAEDEGYMAYCLSLPGCYSNGKTIEDAKRNMGEAVQQHLQSLLSPRLS